LNVAILNTLPLARRRNALRSFVASAGCELPSEAKLREIAGPLLHARSDAQPAVQWSNVTMRRRAGRVELRVTQQPERKHLVETALKSWHWSHHRELLVNGRGDRLVLVDDAAGPIDLDKLPAAPVLRARAGGEKLRPGPRARTQSLKKLMQAARMTVEERARLPLLFAGEGPKGRLIAAGDRWLDASVIATVKSRRRARLMWSRHQ
jgi:tRNA(Ile)-lysidine synthase